jgi:hypothetical protein
MRALFAIFVRRKSMYHLLICGRFKFAKSQKRLGLQITNPQRVTFAEGAQIKHKALYRSLGLINK